MGLDDLIESMRNCGYFSLDDVDYAVFESNGQLSALESKQKTERGCRTAGSDLYGAPFFLFPNDPDLDALSFGKLHGKA